MAFFLLSWYEVSSSDKSIAYSCQINSCFDSLYFQKSVIARLTKLLSSLLPLPWSDLSSFFNHCVRPFCSFQYFICLWLWSCYIGIKGMFYLKQLLKGIFLNPFIIPSCILGGLSYLDTHLHSIIASRSAETLQSNFREHTTKVQQTAENYNVNYICIKVITFMGTIGLGIPRKRSPMNVSKFCENFCKKS